MYPVAHICMRERPKESEPKQPRQRRLCRESPAYFDFCARLTSVASVTLSSSDSNAR
jgi:hypothetical protein